MKREKCVKDLDRTRGESVIPKGNEKEAEY